MRHLEEGPEAPHRSRGIMHVLSDERNTTRTIICSLAILSLASGCSTLGRSYQVTKLPSGKEIRLIGVGQISYPNDRQALILKYQTELNIDDKVALSKEIEEIWSVFKSEVEKAHLSNAIISANEVPKGFFINRNRSFNYVFKKSAEGIWVMQ